MLHLAKQHRVAQCRSGAVGSNPALTRSGRPQRQTFAQVLFTNQFGQTFLQVGKLFFNREQLSILIRSGLGRPVWFDPAGCGAEGGIQGRIYRFGSIRSRFWKAYRTESNRC